MYVVTYVTSLTGHTAAHYGTTTINHNVRCVHIPLLAVRTFASTEHSSAIRNIEKRSKLFILAWRLSMRALTVSFDSCMVNTTFHVTSRLLSAIGAFTSLFLEETSV